MSEEKILKCYVEHDKEVRYLELRLHEGLSVYMGWMSPGLYDDMHNMDEFLEEFPDRYYDSLDDYKKGICHFFSEWISKARV